MGGSTVAENLNVDPSTVCRTVKLLRKLVATVENIQGYHKKTTKMKLFFLTLFFRRDFGVSACNGYLQFSHTSTVFHARSFQTELFNLTVKP